MVQLALEHERSAMVTEMKSSVLVIEDNEKNLTLATDLLELMGFHTLRAADAEVGIAIAIAQQPALILMDIQLPGTDGFEATRRLKANFVTSHIPVIALTALAMKGDAERCYEAGCSGYISKPIRVKEFRDQVMSVISADV